MDTVFVSCVLPARGGRAMARAVWYFLRQDHAGRELVIVDDGDGPAPDIPQDSRIRYIRVTHSCSDAAKRSIGCEAGRGEVIAQCDEDAWYPHDRVSAQLQRLLQSDVDVSVAEGLLYYQPVTGRLWRHDAPPDERTCRATLMHRRDRWRGDALRTFLEAADRSVIDSDPDLAVVILPGRSAGPVNPADPRWRPHAHADLARLVGGDLPSLVRVSGRPPDPPAPVTLAASFLVYDGYGSMAESLALGLDRAGADIHVAPLRIDPVGLSDAFGALLRRSRPDPSGIVVCHAWWGENLSRYAASRDLFVKTAWETSRLPADWPARLDRASAVIVPSRFVAEVCRESGVRAPVEVVYEGADPEIYPLLRRRRRSVFTTLIVGVLEPRKNIDHAVRAWQLAFDGDPAARLVIKTRFGAARPDLPDPRITIVDSNQRSRGILDWYQRADVLLALGNEGFGLPLVEAMATGLPAVALATEAQAEICSDATGLVLPVQPSRWEPVRDPLFGDCGVRAIPDVEDAARQLRWVADNRRTASDMGRKASTWAHRHRNVQDMGAAVVDVIERHARTPRPVRPGPAIWAPPGEAAYGFQYYVDELVQHLPSVRRYADPPHFWRSPTLHVQHASGLVDPEKLERRLRDAEASGTATVVTHHDVGSEAAVWEQAAHVLVAVSATDAAVLRARWPSKRVELIPPAWPEWNSSPRRRNGRVVVVLGGATVPTAGQVIEIGVPGGTPAPPSSQALAELLNTTADVVVCPAGGYLRRLAESSGVPVVGEPYLVPEVLDSPARRAELIEAARARCSAHSWQQVAAMHHALWATLR